MYPFNTAFIVQTNIILSKVNLGTKGREKAEGKMVGTMEQRLPTTRPLSRKLNEILNASSIYVSSFQPYFLRPQEKLGNKCR